MLDRPFFTDIDSRAAIKGSRDPLGIQPIWTRFGRNVVGNLTTVSGSVASFKTLLLGHHIGGQVVEASAGQPLLPAFIRWEQLAAYSRRLINDDRDIRGIERVNKNLSEGTRVWVSDEPRHQLLASQKTYGIWGLYTMPAAASGLLDGAPVRLAPRAGAFVAEQYLTRLEAHGAAVMKRLRDVLRKPTSRVDLEGADDGLGRAVAAVFAQELNQQECTFFREFLLEGGPLDGVEGTRGLQRTLVSLIEEDTNTMPKWSRARVREYAKRAAKRGGDWGALAERLERIALIESVCAPAANLFEYLLGAHGVELDGLVADVKTTWGAKLRSIDAVAFAELKAEVAGGIPEVGESWVQIANALASGAYREAIELLVRQNAWVMTSRNSQQGEGAPWVEIESGRLDVHFRDENTELHRIETIEDELRFPYFLASLERVSRTVRRLPDV
jgi:hypothetical protein